METAVHLGAKLLGYIEQLDEKLKSRKVDVLERAHETTKVPRAYIVVVATLSALGLIFFGFGAQFVINVIGFAWPAYQTFKAIETDTKEDDKHWLAYWVCFGILSLLDTLAFFVLQWIPFFHLAKLSLLVYMMFPQTRGAVTVYETCVRPFLKMWEPKIDASVEHANKTILKMVSGKDDAAAAASAGPKSSWATVAESDRERASLPAAVAEGVEGVEEDSKKDA